MLTVDGQGVVGWGRLAGRVCSRHARRLPVLLCIMDSTYRLAHRGGAWRPCLEVLHEQHANQLCGLPTVRQSVCVLVAVALQ